MAWKPIFSAWSWYYSSKSLPISLLYHSIYRQLLYTRYGWFFHFTFENIQNQHCIQLLFNSKLGWFRVSIWNDNICKQFKRFFSYAGFSLKLEDSRLLNFGTLSCPTIYHQYWKKIFRKYYTKCCSYSLLIRWTCNNDILCILFN